MGKRSYEQLGLTERIEIYRLHADGKSLRFIAGVLERSVSTISRELKRNSKASKKWTGGYDPQRAQELMRRRHARGRAHKLERQPELRQQVLQRLAESWSPEQIAGRMAQVDEPAVSRSMRPNNLHLRRMAWARLPLCARSHRASLRSLRI